MELWVLMNTSEHRRLMNLHIQARSSMVEQQSPKLKVEGSSPSVPATSAPADMGREES